MIQGVLPRRLRTNPQGHGGFRAIGKKNPQLRGDEGSVLVGLNHSARTRLVRQTTVGTESLMGHLANGLSKKSQVSR